ncbi:hypothetical protein ASD79_15600 [Caulobacter sp. Root655]|uniref:transglutaminase family protein n=1 Tax=Caulobacter sp. Root655 TaxID=1736578 RepID=UPI0006FAD82C|nr:transglutaminase family protein [Caulobacter sp. Root655]KRA57741.1 hypothetical protein ASD79_15600 [Caulobacter sp. Root655]
MVPSRRCLAAFPLTILLEPATALAASPGVVATVKAIFAQPDERLDYARTKLAFDRIVAPATNAIAIMAQLDALAKAATEIAGPGAPDLKKLAFLRHVIYDAGPWNGGRAFSYDLTDPLGQKPGNQQLATYLTTRRGNCVSMPTLFLILAEKMRIKGIALVDAPLHLFIRYTDETGKPLNLETTNGANPTRDAWYREKLPMSDRAIASGLYMRPLTRREAIGDLALGVVDDLITKGHFEQAGEVAEVIVKNAPRNGHAMVKSGTAYAGLLQRDFIGKYANPDLVPVAQRPRYLRLIEKNKAAFWSAEALGWEPVE